MNDALENIIKHVIYTHRPVGFDIDDTLIDFEPFFRKGLNTEYDLNMTYDDLVLFDTSQVMYLREKGITQQQYCSLLRKMGNQEEFTRLKARPGALDTISILTTDPQKLHLVTSRSDDLYDDPQTKTYENLDEIGLRYLKSNVAFGVDKAEYAQQHNLALFFDDSPANALALIENGIDVIIPNKNWNRMTPRDSTLLTKEQLELKRDLVDRLSKYEKKNYLFRIDDFVSLNKYLATNSRLLP